MKCHSCDSPARVLITEGVLPSGAAVYRCPGCGLDFIPGAGADDYWGTQGQDDIYTEGKIAAERARFFDSILERVEMLAMPGSLLDVGAGRGEFALRALSRGWETSIVEPSAAATEGLANAGVKEVYNTPFEDLAATKTYQCVTLLDVLEHTRDPAATLRKAAACLKPGGILVVLTPDGGSAFRRAALLASRLSRHFEGLLKYQYYLPHVSYVHARWFERIAASAGAEMASLERVATPKMFLIAKLERHYGKYPGNRLFTAAVRGAYPAVRGCFPNKLLALMRKA